MPTFLMYLLFALGLFLIIKGGDMFVDGASWIADASGIPKFIVGATVVSFGTTLPEMLVSFIAAGQGKVSMACGNAIGSVTANIALIMSVSILFMPMVIKRGSYIVKSVLMLAAIALLLVFSLDGNLTVLEALPVLVIFAAFIFENIYSSRKETDKTSARPAVNAKSVLKNVVFLVIGLAGIVIGSNLLVDNGSSIARSLGVSEAVISLTAIAIGTSLPELVTTVTAIVKKVPSLSLGNIIGANIIDMTLILPVSAIISGGTISGAEFLQTARIDLPVCLLVGSIALIPTLIAGKFRRWQGAAMLACYAGYLALIFIIDAGILTIA